MKIAYLTSLYARASDTFIRLEVRLLREMGHEVATFSIRRPGASEIVGDEVAREHQNTEYILHAGASRLMLATLQVALAQPMSCLGSVALALRTRAPGVNGLLRALAYFVEAAYLARRLRARQIQHLHIHIAENSATVAMLASNLTGIPFSMTIHGPSEFDRPLDLALGEKIRRAIFVAVISEFTRSQVMRWCDPAEWTKIHVVRCGLDRDFLEAPFVAMPSDNRMVCVGRLAGAKGQHVLIEALARLAAENLSFSLEFVGDGELRSMLEAVIAEHRLGDRVRILGWRNSADVRRALDRARLLVLPSFAEGLPVVIMEALALGRPVVTTYIAGIPELVQSGVNGWLVPAGSVDELVTALRDALSRSAADLERMGRAGALRVRSQHSGAIEVKRLEALITRRPDAGQPLRRFSGRNPAGSVQAG